VRGGAKASIHFIRCSLSCSEPQMGACTLLRSIADFTLLDFFGFIGRTMTDNTMCFCHSFLSISKECRSVVGLVELLRWTEDR